MRLLFITLCLNIIAFSYAILPGGCIRLPHNSKARAAILNAAIGDALGRVTEFMNTTRDIHDRFGSKGVTSLSQVTMEHPITQETIAPYTDDTLMAVIVLQKAFEGNHAKSSAHDMVNTLAYSFAELFGDKKYTLDPLYNVRAHGIRNTKAGAELNQLMKLKKDNVPYWWLQRDAKSIATEAGCGSVMRVWPLGLVFADNIPLLIELADGQSQITHRHPMARAASVAMAVGVAKAYAGKSVDETVGAMIAAAQRFDAEELCYKTHAKKERIMKCLLLI
jgi:ADP-ribosylglycohydrolase